MSGIVNLTVGNVELKHPIYNSHICKSCLNTFHAEIKDSFLDID